MALDRRKLANIDRRLLAELDRKDDWQLVKVPASPATWSTWKRYCDVIGLSMGRAIAALIDTELASVVEDDLDTQAVAIAERTRMLDARARELDEREKKLEHFEGQLNVRRRPSHAELESMAAQLEPTDPGSATERVSTGSEAPVFKSAGRNERCPCGSGLKYKRCHGSPTGC